MNNKDFEPIRIRIMQEAYELADRGDSEGYNSVKVMCNDVQNLLRREWVGLTNEQIEDCFDESCHLKVVDPKGGVKGSVNIFEVGRAIEAKFKEKNTCIN